MTDDDIIAAPITEALYNAWWQGVVDSRASVGDQPSWSGVNPRNRRRFYEWAGQALAALRAAGYDIVPTDFLIRVDSICSLVAARGCDAESKAELRAVALAARGVLPR